MKIRIQREERHPFYLADEATENDEAANRLGDEVVEVTPNEWKKLQHAAYIQEWFQRRLAQLSGDSGADKKLKSVGGAGLQLASCYFARHCERDYDYEYELSVAVVGDTVTVPPIRQQS